MVNTGKGKRAVLVSVAYEGAQLRLSLDDVVRQGGTPVTWNQAEHFTSKLFPRETFDELDFDEKELADFGYQILARLYAFKSCGET